MQKVMNLPPPAALPAFMAICSLLQSSRSAAPATSTGSPYTMARALCERSYTDEGRQACMHHVLRRHSYSPMASEPPKGPFDSRYFVDSLGSARCFWRRHGEAINKLTCARESRVQATLSNMDVQQLQGLLGRWQSGRSRIAHKRSLSSPPLCDAILPSFFPPSTVVS